MSAAATSLVSLGDRYARELPELALPWQARELPEARLLLLNAPLAADLGLDPEMLRSPEGVGLLSGTAVPEGATPVAQAYAGHQFGMYSPRLGDGRALLLGEILTPGGDTLDLHLKGSGRTPFARGGDGLAALAPMLREYVVSEAMHALGVPTTRSLAVVATGQPVRREGMLPGALLARVAASHLRVGTFQYAWATGDVELVRRLAHHAIDRHHPQAAQAPNPYLALFEGVVATQAALVAQWMLVGFVHGVMNTDNVAISGETIDYGPCAFMDVFDLGSVYSSIDHGGRYAYGRQPAIAEWNLARLGETLLPLIDDDVDAAAHHATESLAGFRDHYARAWYGGMARKLGLPEGLADDVVTPLVDDLVQLLQDDHVDFTGFFRALTAAAGDDRERPRAMLLDIRRFDEWAERWYALAPTPGRMERVNPVYVPRNHLVEEALAAATAGDLAPLTLLLDAVSSPFDERPGLERHAEPAPDDFGTYTTFCGT
jgi:serine/tyrosine/threonine adenylyltransferase